MDEQIWALCWIKVESTEWRRIVLHFYKGYFPDEVLKNPTPGTRFKDVDSAIDHVLIAVLSPKVNLFLQACYHLTDGESDNRIDEILNVPEVAAPMD
jgi:hypothetical protein